MELSASPKDLRKTPTTVILTNELDTSDYIKSSSCFVGISGIENVSMTCSATLVPHHVSIKNTGFQLLHKGSIGLLFLLVFSLTRIRHHKVCIPLLVTEWQPNYSYKWFLRYTPCKRRCFLWKTDNWFWLAPTCPGMLLLCKYTNFTIPLHSLYKTRRTSSSIYSAEMEKGRWLTSCYLVLLGCCLLNLRPCTWKCTWITYTITLNIMCCFSARDFEHALITGSVMVAFNLCKEWEW